MRWRAEGLACAEAGEALEPYLDGELPPAEAARLEAHLAACPACARELELAGEIRRELRALPALDCPAPALERVLREARASAPPPRRARLRPALLAPRALRIQAAAALLALLAGAGLLLWLSPAPQPEAAEVARATAEARLALAYVGRASQRAGLALRDEVLSPHLVTPAARSLARTLHQTLGESAAPGAAERKGT